MTGALSTSAPILAKTSLHVASGRELFHWLQRRMPRRQRQQQRQQQREHEHGGGQRDPPRGGATGRLVARPAGCKAAEHRRRELRPAAARLDQGRPPVDAGRYSEGLAHARPPPDVSADASHGCVHSQVRGERVGREELVLVRRCGKARGAVAEEAEPKRRIAAQPQPPSPARSTPSA
eukprot:CAMPEP_0196690166 /NCGR_PEP_ID=MMETSP1090-20130531/19753_1 /TAXON_ID=37098 /ORGANISM="Isochrysis sp, Strain CCMP1244" /LENGTH=177 /DNA_ID=CAMNT_0042029253 /DNA_START=43 /DNA_END=573 /DNA_ORIENTATION=-